MEKRETHVTKTGVGPGVGPKRMLTILMVTKPSQRGTLRDMDWLGPCCGA
jgi:hypothetical protein